MKAAALKIDVVLEEAAAPENATDLKKVVVSINNAVAAAVMKIATTVEAAGLDITHVKVAAVEKALTVAKAVV